jgi:hypothetical protein
MSDNVRGGDSQVLSFGQKAVGATFNPSSNPTVDEIKRLYGAIIEFHDHMRDIATSSGAKRYYSKAISYAEDAQMNAVKAATWQYE